MKERASRLLVPSAGHQQSTRCAPSSHTFTHQAPGTRRRRLTEQSGFNICLERVPAPLPGSPGLAGGPGPPASCPYSSGVSVPSPRSLAAQWECQWEGSEQCLAGRLLPLTAGAAGSLRLNKYGGISLVKNGDRNSYFPRLWWGLNLRLYEVPALEFAQQPCTKGPDSKGCFISIPPASARGGRSDQ